MLNYADWPNGMNQAQMNSYYSNQLQAMAQQNSYSGDCSFPGNYSPREDKIILLLDEEESDET